MKASTTKLKVFQLASVIFTLLFSRMVHAQEPKLIWSNEITKPFSDRGGFPDFQLVCKTDKTILLSRKTGYSFSTLLIDREKLSMIKETQIINWEPQMGSNTLSATDFEADDKIFNINGRYYGVIVKKEEADKSEEAKKNGWDVAIKADFYIQEFTFDGFLKGEKKLVSTNIVKNFSLISPFGHSVNIISDDSSRFLIIHEPREEKFVEQNYKLGERRKFTVQIIDENGKVTDDFGFTLPYSGKDNSIEKYEFGRDGKLYLLVKVVSAGAIGSNGGEAVANYNYKLVRLSPGANPVLEELETGCSSGTIINMSFTINAAGNIICSGFYNNNVSEPVEVTGTFVLKIDGITGKKIAEDKKQFDSDLVSRILNTRKSKTKSYDYQKIEVFRIKSENIFLKKDGGVVFVWEEEYNTREGSKHSGAFDHVHANINVIQTTVEGKVGMYANIPKYQHGSYGEYTNISTYQQLGTSYSSFTCYFDGEKLLFLYNEHKKNAKDRNPNGEPNTTSSGVHVLTLAILDNIGHVTYKTLFDAIEKGQRFIPGCGAISNNEILGHTYELYAHNMRLPRYYLIKLVF